MEDLELGSRAVRQSMVSSDRRFTGLNTGSNRSYLNLYNQRNTPNPPYPTPPFDYRKGPDTILHVCRQIDRGIDDIQNELNALAHLQQLCLVDPDSSAQFSKLDDLNSTVMAMYRTLADDIKMAKNHPNSSSPHVGRVEDKLKNTIKNYYSQDLAFQKKLRDQIARQYRIVRPEASEAEIQNAVEDPSRQQIFSQALLQSDRRGKSRAALDAVRSRHEEIKKSERQVAELVDIFHLLDDLVVQQESSVYEYRYARRGLSEKHG